MTKCSEVYVADYGRVFVLTETGYIKTPMSVRNERKVGEPIRHFEHRVPRSWVDNGWVVEDRHYEDDDYRPMASY